MQVIVLAPSLSRRNLLRGSVAAGFGLALAGSVEAIADPTARKVRTATVYGPLVADPAGILSLPAGFSYQIVAQSGSTKLESGELTPSDPDGTACFANPNGGFTLVNNHENGGIEPFGVPPLAGLTYDPGARGGTTTIEVDQTGKRLSEYVSLAGTHNNCAGGRTPWNTWLTCEETEQRAGGLFQKNHGYVFEVDAFDRSANQAPVPLKFLGRYAHEAVAVQPGSSRIYLTEDAGGPNGLYYRWLPPAGFKGEKGALRALALSAGGDTAGRLQAMRCLDGNRHVPDLAEATEPDTRYKVEWVDVPDRDAKTFSVRKQFS